MEAGSLDWCSLNLYLRNNLAESLSEAEKIVRKWTDKLRDEWNYTDISTGWDGYPFFTPQADGLIESLAGGKWRLTVVSGRLELNELTAVKEKKSGPISLRAGESVEF